MPENPFDFDGKYQPSGDVRHVIDWSGYSGAVNIPDQLRLFYSFLEEPNKRRISFIVQNGTVYREQFSFKIYSKDPQVSQFNKIFSQANGQIPNFLKSVLTYDYDTKGANIPIIPERLKQEAEDFLKNASNIILIALAAFLGWKIFESSGRK
ncbi:hypothetical protein [Leptospira interrogans]|uniref:hypothetical protein n=1 Tax=Leptospira interrogans TaxID=173 RepID=UPI000297602D|nr:hypothetical protein [Leptospira interrogans]KAA1293791.1 hypothetical protein C4X99_01540 [Leptospira interrogans serovar Geyaweera]EKR33873.1 hypothetical protein LEP1GSC096_2072 [Leptospira interrogans serovar Hebdomadis str. R499]EMN40664.1 hypothetical protein LEP1GSC085_2856 [Leptospira interrogans str. L0996]EMN82978.1 hypothetical protein LEP1GSC106_1314 [Leptospira interrogans serovar Grippotyphosa str. UI 12764]KGE21317.1 hypothetical protein IQ65_23910 [Leptospira interrogans ser